MNRSHVLRGVPLPTSSCSAHDLDIGPTRSPLHLLEFLAGQNIWKWEFVVLGPNLNRSDLEVYVWVHRNLERRAEIFQMREILRELKLM